VKTNVKIRMQIVGVHHEDGSGQSFTLEAHILNSPTHKGLYTFPYNARTRTGYLNLLK
jgi:hypothetical protein